MMNKNDSMNKTDFKYRCVADMRELSSGHWKNTVIVGNGPDARTAELLYRAKVIENRPSQNGLKFDNGNILKKEDFGKKRFCFLSNLIVDELFRRQEALPQFCRWVNDASPDDVTALYTLLMTDIGIMKASCHAVSHHSYRRELTDLAACFDSFRLRTFTSLISRDLVIKTAA